MEAVAKVARAHTLTHTGEKFKKLSTETKIQGKYSYCTDTVTLTLSFGINGSVYYAVYK